MAGNLVIVESPAKAKTIQKYLGDDYIVRSSYGHIRDLQEKKLSIDVEGGFKPEYVIPADKKKTVAELTKLAHASDKVWLASDEDREGEAISWHLSETLGLDPAKTSRIAFHEITKEAILNAIKNPRTIDMDMVNAQQARRVLDRLVGFELSPILWRKIQKGLSAGRVQSVALRLVVDREKEIMAFDSQPYYKVDGVFTPAGTSSKVKATLDTKFDSEAEARKFLEDSIGASYAIDSLETKDTLRYPAPPFTTSTLQQEAARKLHFPVGTTMRIAQSLYERGLITYMRTDSTNLSTLALGTSKKYITENFGADYLHTRQYKTHTKGAQEAHEAIRPTFIENTTIEGTAQEQKLYSLIWKRTVASQMAEAKLASTSMKLASDKRSEKFAVQASKILFDGFLKVYMEGSDDEDQTAGDEVILPDMHIGDHMLEKGITAECKFTQAPPRYSQATIVKKLEELGIGRPSTWATIITTLTTSRGYIAMGDKEGTKHTVTNYALKGSTISSQEKVEVSGAEKNKLLPLDKGMIVTDWLVDNFAHIMDYSFTADVENDLDKVASGEKQWNNVISDFYGPFHRKVEETLSDGKFSKVSRELGIDPADGKLIIAKYGQFGAYVQKGEGDDRQYASLGKGQLIENLTLEEAIKLLELPRKVGSYEDIDIIATKGRFGPYLKYGDTNVSLPRGKDPLKVTLEECIKLIEEQKSKPAANAVLAEFPGDIQVINGRYGPYIKCNGANYRLPKGTDASTLTEEACRKIMSDEQPAQHSTRRTYRRK